MIQPILYDNHMANAREKGVFHVKHLNVKMGAIPENQKNAPSNKIQRTPSLDHFY